MGGIIVRLVVMGFSLWVAQFFVNMVIPEGMGLTTTLPDVLIVALIFGIVNALVKPVFALLSCPITILTLGLFTLVINALMLMLTAWLTSVVGDSRWLYFTGPGDGFVAALLAGIIVGVVSTVLTSLAGDA